METDDPGAPRSQGRGHESINPGAPRSQGRGSEDTYPGAPRSQGQGTESMSPGAPRSQGQGTENLSPGAPRSQGQGTENLSPGAPRSQGRGMYNDDPGAPRSQGREFGQTRSNDSSVTGREWRQDNIRFERDYEPDEGRHSRSDERPGRESRRRRRDSSEDSNELYPNGSKRSRLTNSVSRESESAILDKFLDILKRFKNSDKPKLTFNTNVVPEFDPMSKEQTVLTWLTKVEECATIYRWDDRETIHYTLPKLTGVAKTWYQGLPSLLLTWTEWKKKLIESFPCREDYAELLTEMLSKRVRYGDSLEQYYYGKVNLLNRCKIYGRQAVDCILYGIDDRAVKVGAQAAQFSEPEQVLKYFKTVKVGGQSRDRDNQDTSRRSRHNEQRQNSTHPSTSGETSIKCYNCNEMGHRSTKCGKSAVKCTHCEKLGHLAEHCFKRLDQHQAKDDGKGKERVEKQVAE